MADTRKQSTASNTANSPTAQESFPTGTAGSPPTATSPASPTIQEERRDSDEWDASKVPPSRFQKRKGSIYAVPSSRDGHIDSNYPAKFHQMHAEKGYGKK
ncbi:hypothetical protein N656DRAFT_782350 [Canariomyces notabilis]|uniref:Uncharacterized protein n=1 Tax=Canariomyces notabilis TaxID=2074819 RepID=A0AAN6QGX0_9PEZI|nr:hypothetical protein N656DRAFT_782350 [Canariomyces arenarius]